MSRCVQDIALEEPFPRLRLEARGAPMVMGITRRGVADPENAVAEWARSRFFQLARGAQIHEATIVAVDPAPGSVSGFRAQRFDRCDGLVTATRGVLLAISAADCVPALVYSEERHALAAVHAGWRGVAARIVPRAVERLRLEYAVDPRSCRAIWGPAIGACCYPVGGDVVEQLEASLEDDDGGWRRERGGEVHVNLRGLLTRQAVEAGLEAGAIASSPLCTSCDTRLESHRRDGERSGRMLFYSGMPLP